MANDFTGDAIALWRFESGALGTDSIGGNDLTSAAAGTAAADAKEGDYSIDLDASYNQGYYCAEVDLDSGFPLKSGDTTKVISICGWFKIDASGTTRMIFTKFDPVSDLQSMRLYFNGADSKLNFMWGYGNWNGVTYTLVDSVSTDVWYHFGIVIDGVNKTFFARVWNDDTESYEDTSETPASEIGAVSAPFTVGCYIFSGTPTSQWDGHLDEFVVFDREITAAEINAIRQGTFGAVSASINTGDFSQSFNGGASLVINSDDQGTNDFSFSFMGGVLICLEKTEGSGPGGGGVGGLFFCHG